MKGLQIYNEEGFVLACLEIDKHFLPFDDNGDIADGNAYLLPLNEIPEGIKYENYGDIVELKKIEYDQENRPEDSKWIGWSSIRIGYVVLE